MAAVRQLLILLIVTLVAGTVACESSTVNPNPDQGFGYTPLVPGFLNTQDSEELPLSGAWRLQLNASTNGVITAQTLNFMAYTISPTRALGFFPARTGDAMYYVDAGLSSSNFDGELNIWEPGDDRDTQIILRGVFDLGDGTLTSGTYTASVRTGATGRTASGTFRLDVRDHEDLDEFEPVDDGPVAGLRFVLADEDGTGFRVATGTIDLDIDGGDATGSLDLTVTSTTGAIISEGTLDIDSAARVGDYVNFSIADTLDGVDYIGQGRVKLIDPESDSIFDEDGLGSGALELVTNAGLSDPLDGADFIGVIGQGQ